MIIVTATTKGGAGKTTLARELAGHFARQGKTVEGLDADRNANLVDQLRATGIPCAAVDEDALIDAATAAAERSEVVIVDVGGAASRGLLYAVGVADFVLIACRTDRRDVLEAARTQEVIFGAGKLVKRSIRHAAVLTDVSRRALVTGHTRGQLIALDVPVLDAELPHRTAYQQASFGAGVTTDPACHADIAAIAAEVMQRMEA